MPWTGHDIPFKFSLAERASPMGASVVSRLKGPVDIKDRDGVALNLYHLTGAGKNLLCSDYPDVFSHRLLLLLLCCSTSQVQFRLLTASANLLAARRPPTGRIVQSTPSMP